MNKSKQLIVVNIIIFLMMLNITSVRGQGSCGNPYSLLVSQNIDTTYTNNDSVLWLQFQAVNDKIEFVIKSSNNSVISIGLFSGPCNSLNSISVVNDTLISNDTLTINNFYYLKINLSSSVSTNISVKGACLTCVPHAVLTVNPNPVCIGDVVTFDNSGSNFCNNNYAMWDWGGFQGTLLSSNPYTYIANSSGSFKVNYYIVYDIMLLNGTIEVVKVDSASVILEVLDSLPRFEYPDTICLGDTVNFIDKSICPTPTSWNWDFGDGSTSSLQNPSHTYNQVGSYTVTLQTFPAGYTRTSTIEVINAETPIISGYKNNCDSTVTYSITNYDPNYTYTWSTQVYNQSNNQSTTGLFIINGTSNVVTANSAIIDWNSAAFPLLPNYVIITVEAQLNGSNCSAISTYKVYECCDPDIGPDAIHWHDTTFTSTQSIQGKNISINGTVTLKDSLLINTKSGHGVISFGPYAKIVLDTGGYFEMHSGVLSGGCTYMWDGVFANTISEKVKLRSVLIEDAINGIVSEHGAPLYIDSCNFINNLIGVQILNHKSQIYPIPPPPFTPGQYSITNCNFGISSANPLVLTYPYNNKQSLTGIKISNVEGVNIGDNTLGGNYFIRLRNGITIYNSKVNIYNNEFHEIENQMGPAPTHEAAISINSISIYDMANISNVLIGSSGNNANEFSNCEKSIYSNNSKLLVDNNVFKYGHKSIDIYNFKNGTMIKNNRFKDVEFGVDVNNLLGVSRKLDIMDNYFEGQADNSVSTVSRGAINTINCNSSPNSSIRSKVSNNTIRYAGQKNFITYGIRVQNSDGIVVNSNFISRTANIQAINADWNNTIGIRVATSQGATITDNYIWGFGISIETYGNLSATQFSCNELKVYKYGFYWGVFTALSNQGEYNIWNTNNEWASLGSITGNRKLQTPTANILNTSPVKWYHFSNMGNQRIPNAVSLLGNIKIQPTVNDNAVHYCVGGSSGGGNGGSGTSTGGGSSTNSSSPVLGLLDNIEDPELRDFLFEDILNGEHYIDLQNKYRAYDADFLYKMLADDTTMMWLGGGKDADYQHFFDSIRVANIGRFSRVYDLIENGSFEEATNVNNSITPEQEIFANLKTVLGIYLNTWCMNKYTLTSDEYETLFNIANQTPYKGGDAVYTARIMIGFEPDEYGVAYRVQKQDKDISNNDLRLYPNPASDKIIIEFTNDDFEKVDALLQVYTITGKLVYKTAFSTINSFKQLSVDMLKNGIYIYHISFSNGIDKTGKLVILK